MSNSYGVKSLPSLAPSSAHAGVSQKMEGPHYTGFILSPRPALNGALQAEVVSNIGGKNKHGYDGYASG